MTKGAVSEGKRATKPNMVRCRRCGRVSFHNSKKVCASCGFGKSARMRSYSWARK